MVKRILVWVGALVALAVVGVAVYVARTWDRVYDAPLPDVQVSTDPAVIARGEYLVYGPGVDQAVWFRAPNLTSAKGVP